MEYGAIYYSEELNRLVVICPTKENKMKVEGILKTTGNYGEGEYELDPIVTRLIKMKYELVGYL